MVLLIGKKMAQSGGWLWSLTLVGGMLIFGSINTISKKVILCPVESAHAMILNVRGVCEGLCM